MTLSRTQIYDFLTRDNRAVISTVGENDMPEAALVNFGVTRDLELVFETLQTSRKYANLLRNPHAAIVTGFDPGHDCLTCQYEGVVDQPDVSELPELLETYFTARPESLKHRDWPGLVYLRVNPRWVRISNYGMGLDWNVEEWTCPSPRVGRGMPHHAGIASAKRSPRTLAARISGIPGPIF